MHHEILQSSCKVAHSRRCYYKGSGAKLRKIEIDVKDKDYLDFLSVCIDEELSVEDKLKNIIRYHVISYRNRMKMRHSKLSPNP